MPTSQQLLRLLDLLEGAKLEMDSVVELVRDRIKRDASHVAAVEPNDVAEKRTDDIRALFDAWIRTRETPLHLGKIFSHDATDHYFSRRLLSEVSAMVDRWRQLRAVSVALLPGDKVAGYLREAINCYVQGFPVSAAILCRAILEFTLQERLAGLGGLKGDHPDLEGLIRLAGWAKLLSAEGLGNADRVRVRGNSALHKAACTDQEALTQIQETREILLQLYGTRT